jgi:O-antigen/teichoic acid export membrane protein
MGFAWAFTGAMVLGGVTGIAYLFSSLPPTSDTRLDFGEKAILRAALPLMVVSGANILYTSIDTLMVGYFGTAGETGVYKASWTVARVTLVPLLAAAFLAMPALSEFHANEERKSVNRLYSMIVKWITLVSLPILVVFLSYADGIMQIIYGVEYAVGGTELAILSIGFFSHCITGNNEGLMVSIGDERRLAVISAFALVSNISLNILLIPAYGSVGAAIGTAATFVVMNILISFSLYRYHGLKVRLSGEKAGISLVFAPLTTIYFLPNLVTGSYGWLILCIGALLVVYLYVVFQFGVTKEEEKNVASKIAWTVGLEKAVGRML